MNGMECSSIDKKYKVRIMAWILHSVWTLSSFDEQQLRIFESKILRKNFGPVQNSDSSWRIRMNHELDYLIQGADIVRIIKSRRLAWLGHVARMEGNRITRRVMEWKPMGRRMRGRPRKRWIDDVEEDIRRMGVRGWRRIVNDRTEWKKFIKQAKTHTGL
jgi:hypothetical protein